jgi:hypothetical protein
MENTHDIVLDTKPEEHHEVERSEEAEQIHEEPVADHPVESKSEEEEEPVKEEKPEEIITNGDHHAGEEVEADAEAKVDSTPTKPATNGTDKKSKKGTTAKKEKTTEKKPKSDAPKSEKKTQPKPTPEPTTRSSRSRQTSSDDFKKYEDMLNKKTTRSRSKKPE